MEMRSYSALRNAYQSEARDSLGKKLLEQLAASIRASLQEVARASSAVRYPYNPEFDPSSLADRLLGTSRGFTELESALDAAGGCIERFPQEHARVIGELIELAQAVESILEPAGRPAANAAPSVQP
jgi:hypothetical protein